MQKVIVITGPTGVGKTKLSIEIAKRYNGEIINGDAIQIYKGMNIGSAKIKEEEMEGIKHHLFSIKDVVEDYSIYNYQVDCRNKIKEIQDMGKVAIIVGGTGLYIKSALYDYTLDSEKNDIDNEYKDISTEELYKRLKLLDKDIQIDKFNRRRVIRALNYYLENNKSIKSNDKGNNLLYDTLFIGLTCNRDVLYKALTEYGYEITFPDGAFYLWVKALEEDANQFAEHAKKFELLLVPSDSFGMKGYVRIAYCQDPKMIERSLPAFKKLILDYKG